MFECLPLRIWLMVTITLALGAVIIRLSWAATFIRPVSSMVIIALCTVVTFGIYVLIFYPSTYRDF